MTDIDKVEAGPALDALVAEKVMGWTKHEHKPMPLIGTGRHWQRRDGTRVERWYRQSAYGDDDCCPFSTDISAAWEVVKKMPYGVAVHSPNGRLWRCIIGVKCVPSVPDCLQQVKQEVVVVEAETAPLAICRAALKAAEESDDD